MRSRTLSDRGSGKPDDCNGCGLCLEVCPVYRQSGNLADSPRGKIGLLLALRNDITDAAAVARHLSRCAMCGRCTRICPAGIDIDLLLYAARQKFSGYLPGNKLQGRLASALLARPRLFNRVQPLLSMARSLAALRGKRESRKPDPPALARRAWLPAATGAGNGDKVWLFAGCISGRLAPEVAQAAQRALEKVGIGIYPEGIFACCGKPFTMKGRPDLARKPVSHNLEVFSSQPGAALVTPCPGCVAEIRSRWSETPGLSAGERELAKKLSANAMDIGEYIAGFLPREQAETKKLAAFHRGCLQSDSEAAAACKLASAAGIGLVAGSAGCCGAPVDYQEDPAAEEQEFLLAGGKVTIPAAMLREARKSASAMGAGKIVTGCPRCMLELRKPGTSLEPLRVFHTLQIFAPEEER